MSIPLNIDIQQICLHLLNVSILIFGLYMLLYKPVKGFMEKREAYYREMDHDIKTRLENAKNTEAAYQARLDNVEAEIIQERKNEATRLEQFSAQKIAEAEQQADRIISDAHQAAENEKRQILDSAQKEITDMVLTATEKLLLQSSASTAFDQFLTAAERSDQGE
ncbi:MAG: ATP synthase F0 subunit B [Oscillibacter sp.]|nr:ATP synthase F0 subunit B [Oscillibacter sp.]